MLPKRIVFFGSSSVHGHGDSEVGGFVHRFRLWHEAQSPKNFVYELGVYGETLDSLIKRVESESLPRKPQLIVLYPGFNDIRREGKSDSNNLISVSEYRDLIIQLVATATSISSTIMMTGFPFDDSKTLPFYGTSSYYLFSDAEQYTEIVRNVCNEIKVPILDCFSLWQALDWKKLLTDDGLHANPNGHQVLYQQIRDFLICEYKA